MSLESWRTEIDSYIPQILDGEPDDKKAMLLAALYALQDRFVVQCEIVQPAAENAAKVDMDGVGSKILESIDEELTDVEKYLELWSKTGNKEFKGIAKDELRHAEILIKIVRTENPNSNLQNYASWHGSLLARLV